MRRLVTARAIWRTGAKRAADAVLAILALAALVVPMLLVAATVWSIDGLPILFRQRRIGRYGRAFVLLKFRTMRSVSPEEESGFGAGMTSRVTALGAFLRSTKLDELPQLLNVVRGDMSIVGPRPEVPEWVERCPQLFEPLLAFRPGLTDPSSIALRGEESILARAADARAEYERRILPRKCSLSARYARAAHPCSDAWVVMRTISVILRGRVCQPRPHGSRSSGTERPRRN